jgi:hypothetical protein
MEGRRLVMALLMRGTLHVVSGREYWPIATAPTPRDLGASPAAGAAAEAPSAGS